MHKIALVLAIAAVGAGLLVLHLVRQLHAERESAQALQARVTELERRATQPAAGTAIAAVPTLPTAAPFTVVGPSAPAPQLPQPTELEAEKMRKQMAESFERQRALLRDPEYREAMVAQQKTLLMHMNPDLAKDLELTPEQMERLFATLGEQSVRRMEAEEYLGDVTTDPEGVSARMEEANRKSALQRQADLAELRKVLGDAKYQEWEEYQTLTSVRQQAGRMRQSLASAGVPLDASLAKPLVKALDEYQRKMLQEAAAIPPEPYVPGSTSLLLSPDEQQRELEDMEKWQRQQREALARVLSPQQLKVIEKEQEAEMEMRRTQLRIMRAQQAAGVEPSQGGFAGNAEFVEPARSD